MSNYHVGPHVFGTKRQFQAFLRGRERVLAAKKRGAEARRLKLLGLIASGDYYHEVSGRPHIGKLASELNVHRETISRDMRWIQERLKVCPNCQRPLTPLVFDDEE